jgi:hypothetical protein
MKKTLDYATYVFAIPEDGSPPFLMFINDLGDEYAHRNVEATRRHYKQQFSHYEFRRTGEPTRRFEFAATAAGSS